MPKPSALPVTVQEHLANIYEILRRNQTLQSTLIGGVGSSASAHRVLSATHVDTDSASSPIDGDVLTWDGVAEKWTAQAVASAVAA